MPSQYFKRKQKETAKKDDDTKSYPQTGVDIFVTSDGSYDAVSFEYDPVTGQGQVKSHKDTVDRAVAKIFLTKKEALKRLLKLQGE